VWHTSQNDRSHGMVTHPFGTKFWKQVFGCLAFLIKTWQRKKHGDNVIKIYKKKRTYLQQD
jgi:hypothetical protein